MLLPSGNSFKGHEEVLFLQPMIPPKRFDIIFTPDWGMLRSSRRVPYPCFNKNILRIELIVFWDLLLLHFEVFHIIIYDW